MKLVIELKVLPDKKGVRLGVSTYREAARALRSLCRYFDDESDVDPELVRFDMKGKPLYRTHAHGVVIDHDGPEGVKQVGTWRIAR